MLTLQKHVIELQSDKKAQAQIHFFFFLWRVKQCNFQKSFHSFGRRETIFHTVSSLLVQIHNHVLITKSGNGLPHTAMDPDIKILAYVVLPPQEMLMDLGPLLLSSPV